MTSEGISMKRRGNYSLRLPPVCWEEPRAGASWGRGAQFVRLGVHLRVKQKKGATRRTESAKSIQDFGNTASLNGRNLLTSFSSGRFLLLWVRSKGSFRLSAKPRRSKALKPDRFLSFLMNHMVPGISCLASSIPLIPLGFGLPVSGRITTKKKQKKNFKVHFPIPSKGYFTGDVKISPQKKGKKFHFFILLPSGFFGDFHLKREITIK